MKSAGASLELAFESYQSGVKTILDLLNAENQLAQTRSQQIAARQEVFTALANLAHATGIIEKGGTTFKDSKDNKDARENR
jgi:outer membrane protein TolC